jgi:methylglyoxal synthase
MMDFKTVRMERLKRIAMVAHDNTKDDLLAWARANRETLAKHQVIATGTTGYLLERLLAIPVERMKSGPLGGDLQIGAKIAEGQVDLLVFFWDPLEAQPHDPDVKALLRLAVLWNIPAATNRASADFLFSSTLINDTYKRTIPDYDTFQRSREERLTIEMVSDQSDK